LQTWGEFFFFIIIIFFVDKNRNTGFSSRHLLRLQKFCMNSRFRTGIFWIQWYRFDFAFILVI
jgi:transcription initiation factor IIF auxiliary subunit